jgi:hypothetical protein
MMMAMCCGKVDEACADTNFLFTKLTQARYRHYAQKLSLRLSTGNDKFESLNFDKSCLGRLHLLLGIALKQVAKV